MYIVCTRRRAMAGRPSSASTMRRRRLRVCGAFFLRIGEMVANTRAVAMEALPSSVNLSSPGILDARHSGSAAAIAS
jgi:hypothetical protein